MDAFDAHNELTDKYLRGELTGEQLDQFIRELEQNPELKKDVLFRQQLVSAIQEHGAARLKQYLRSKTTQQKVMKVSFRTWYYAAAAVGLILLASAVFLIYRPGSSFIQNETVTMEKSSGSSQNKNTDIGNEPLRNEGSPSTHALPPPARGAAELPPPVIEDGGLMAGSGSESGLAESPYPEVVTIASNIPVIPIRIESELLERMDSEIEMKPASTKNIEVKKSRRADSKAEVAKSGAVSMDSALAIEKAATMDDSRIAAENTRFKLNFYHTGDAEPMLSLRKTQDPLSTEVLVYNLPYDNPLIFTYQDKYFLKAGTKYYEFNVNKSGKQKVIPVVDPVLLEALNR